MKRIKTEIPNIFMSESGVFYYRKGKVEESLGTNNLKQAVEFKVALEDRLRKYGMQSFKTKFKAAIPKYLKYTDELLEKKEIRPATHFKIHYLIDRHIAPEFGSLKIAEFDEYRWDRYTKKGRVNDYSSHRNVMNGLLKWARRNRLVDRSFALEIPAHKTRGRVILNESQILTILGQAKGSLLLFCSIGILCALRRTEIMTLRWEFVDFKRQCLMLPEDIVKTRRWREVTFNSSIEAMLEERLAGQLAQGIKTPWVFPNARDVKRHATVNGLKTAWKNLKTANPILQGLTWHDFRATFEAYLNKRTDFTDMQKEKYAGASLDVQKKYVSGMKAEDLRGLEKSVQIEGLERLMSERVGEMTSTKVWGKQGEQNKKLSVDKSKRRVKA